MARTVAHLINDAKLNLKDEKHKRRIFDPNLNEISPKKFNDWAMIHFFLLDLLDDERDFIITDVINPFIVNYYRNFAQKLKIRLFDLLYRLEEKKCPLRDD